ncbi:MAG: DUF3387 domain-containing protein [Dechloromonas sp.]|nr:DUF3387 domain-containing protein [Dechloromonas sp.]
MLDDIKKTLWATADKLRANMDAAEYKHLVLGLIFLKYISDTFAARRSELTRRFADEADDYFLHDCDDALLAEELEDRDYYKEVNVFWVPFSEEVGDIFDAVGLDKPNIGILDDAFLAEVKNLPERNLAVELLERLLEGEIKSRFAGNLVQRKKFSELLTNVIKRYQNRAIETAQVIEELIEMAHKFRAATQRGEQLGLTEDEVLFYDALADNESAVLELSDDTLKKIAHELTENLRQNITALAR